MYCIKCGIKLAKGQSVCPVCQVKLYNPDLSETQEISTYPLKEFQSEEINIKGLLFVITILSVIPIVVCTIFDLLNGGFDWSGYVMGGVILGYVSTILPLWFKKPNPVVFVPSTFVAIGLYLAYINYVTGGDWFLTFAFPLTVIYGVIASALSALLRYIKRGRLYTFGGLFMVLSGSMFLLEMFLNITFHTNDYLRWSTYPALVFFIIGAMLIVIELVKPFKESLRRFFFL